MNTDDYWTAQQIADAARWSVRYVQNLASRERWRRLGTRPERYYLPDVVSGLHI